MPNVTPRRITGSGDHWVVEATLDYGDDDTYQCVFVFEMRDGLIAKETGYWSKPFPGARLVRTMGGAHVTEG